MKLNNRTSSQEVSAPHAAGRIQQRTGATAHAEEAVKWTAQGNAHFRRGALEQAIVAFNKAIQIDSSYGVPYSNLALTYVTQGQFAEAILLYQKSIELLETDRDKALSWNGLGNAYRCVGDYSNAVAAYQKAAELDPETGGIRDQADNFQPKGSQRTAKGWNDLGELLLKTGALDKANEAFQKAIEMEPDFGRGVLQPGANPGGRSQVCTRPSRSTRRASRSWRATRKRRTPGTAWATPIAS